MRGFSNIIFKNRPQSGKYLAKVLASFKRKDYLELACAFAPPPTMPAFDICCEEIRQTATPAQQIKIKRYLPGFKTTDDAFRESASNFMSATSRRMAELEAEVSHLRTTFKAIGLHEYVDFSKSLPERLKIEGCDPQEPWGRWSIQKQVRLTFHDPLPKSFSLVLKACAYDPNIGKDMTATVGDEVKIFQILYGYPETRIDFDYNLGGANSIVFNIPAASPPEGSAPNLEGHQKLLGIGFVNLKVEEKP